MDTAIAAAIAALVAGAPNLVVAIWMLSRQDKRIDDLLEAQKWLIEQLMALHPPQDQETDRALTHVPQAVAAPRKP